MSFDLINPSRFLGRPVQLFVVTRQGVVQRYANAASDLTVGGNAYIGGQIEHSEIKETAEKAKDKITVKLAYLRNPAALEFPATQPLGDWFHPYPPGDPVTVTCLLWHYGDADPPVVEWTGRVTQPDFTDTELTLTCEPTSGLAGARGQGPRWQRACWKVPYSTGIRGCGMDPEDFKVTGPLTYASAATLKAALFATSPFNLAGGWISWTNPATGLVERRPIASHAGDTLTVNYGGAGLAVGVEATALPTCPRSWQGCSERFPDPENHYGGALHKPVQNPEGESMSWG